MTRIHVAVSNEEIVEIDEMRKQFAIDNGFAISRQKFLRRFLVSSLKGREIEVQDMAQNYTNPTR